MKNLTTALYTHFTRTTGSPTPVHNAFYNQISGRLYKEVAPQNSLLPYAVYHLISNVPDWNFTNYFENARIQFDLVSKNTSSVEVEDMFTNLKSLYDWCALTVTGNTFLYMRRDLARLTFDIDFSTWVYNVDYLILMERT
jgi:hypothetical protein